MILKRKYALSRSRQTGNSMKKSWFVYSGLSFWSAEQVDKLTLKCLVHMLAQNLFWLVLKILSGSIFFENNPIFLSSLKSEILQNKLAHFSTLIKTHIEGMDPLQSCLPVFLGIHRNPKRKEIFNSCEDFWNNLFYPLG